MRRAIFLGTAAACFAAPLSWAAAAADLPVTVFAAASLREAFEELGAAFTQAQHRVARFEFGASDTLAAQIQQGAPADVFASANEAQMARLGPAALEARIFAHNRLVVVTPARDAAIRTLPDLGRSGVRIALTPPSVPIGAYARAALTRLEREPAYGSGFAARVERNVASEELDVKAVVTKVSLGEADAGIVYATDVTPQLAPKLRTLPFPPGIAPEAAYPIAVVRGGSNESGGRAFVAFVLSPRGAAILRAHGFTA